MSKHYGSFVGSPIEFEVPSGPERTARSADGRRMVKRKFGDAAKLAWRKPAAKIAFHGKVELRTGRRILEGTADVPATVALALLAELLREQD